MLRFQCLPLRRNLPNGAADTVITTKQVDNETKDGAACLINKPSQDQLDPGSNFPTGPQQFKAGSGPLVGQLVSTSRSIASFPIINTPVPATGQVTVWRLRKRGGNLRLCCLPAFYMTLNGNT